jgi:hypothetical protein
MDELTLLRNFHRDTPGPSAAETSAARARLLEAIDDPQPRASHLMAARRRLPVLAVLGRRRLWAPVAAAAAVTAVAITAAAIAAPGPQAARPAPPSGSRAAASVLREAAAAAARQPPGHGRYFATESERIVMYGYPASGAVRIQWIGNGVSGRLAGLDGHTVSGFPDGIPFGDRQLTWAQFRRLPTAPDQLQAAIAGASGYLGPGVPLVATEFSLIANLLASAPGSPALRSSLYQVAARLPGLALVPHARDLIGRAAAEVYFPLQNAALPGGNAMYLNPATGAVLDVAQPGQSSLCPDIFQDAVLASGYVASKYQLPAGSVRTALPVPQLSMFPACGVKPTVLPTPGVTSSPAPAPGETAPAVSSPTPTPVPVATATITAAPTVTPLTSPIPSATVVLTSPPPTAPASPSP